MTILVAENNPSMREMLVDLLERGGYTATGVSNGREALEYLDERSSFAQNSALPCLILLALMMPGMNGWEFRLRQMAEPNWADIPVILISEVADLPAHAATLRVADYLAKPINPGVLLAVVRRHHRITDLAHSDALDWGSESIVDAP